MKLLISLKANENKTLKPFWLTSNIIIILLYRSTYRSASSGKMYYVTHNKTVCIGKGNVKHIARQSS